MKLNRTLNLYDIFFTGYGHIVGAGIYTLLGFTTKYANNLTWLSFIIGGIISLCTGLSYANLNPIYNSNSAEYDYISNTMGKKTGFVIAILLLLIGPIIISTLTLALREYLPFKNYFNSLLLSIIILSIPTIINISSVKNTSKLNILITCLETLGLIAIIICSMNKWNIPKILDFSTASTTNVLRSSFLSIFAFIGFEEIVNLSEETINPDITIPKGIISSIVVATILYALISISTYSILGYNKLSSTNTPISDSGLILLGKNFHNTLDIIAIVSIFSSILLTILSHSRQLYGMSKRKLLPKFISNVNQYTLTPIYAIIITSILSILFTLVNNVELSATLTNIIIFTIFLFVNIAAIIHNHNNNKSIPIYSIFGTIANLVMICISLFGNFFKIL